VTGSSPIGTTIRSTYRRPIAGILVPIAERFRRLPG
jgi:hypothetical protein